MSEENQVDLSQLAKVIHAGKVFTDRHLQHVEDAKMVFMPLGLGAFAGKTEEEIADIGMLYEYMSKAESRTVNGMPMFFSMRVLTVAQADEVWAKVQKIQELLEGV